MQNLEYGEALLNITWSGLNGELPTPVLFDSSDGDIRRWATEAVRGGIPGIDADNNADFGDFVVERFPATAELPARIFLRPKTPFGRAQVLRVFRGSVTEAGYRLVSSIEASLSMIRKQRQ